MGKKLILIFVLVLFFGVVSTLLYIHPYEYWKDGSEESSFASSVFLAVVGDCNGYNIVKYEGESLDPLSSVRSLIEQSDIFLFNMEGVLLPPEYIGSSTRYPNQSCFVSSPSFAGFMKVGSVSIACLANNHVLDGGKIGVEETKIAFEENGIYSLGAGSNASVACQPLFVTVKGVKIGFLAYNLVNELVFSAGEDNSGAASCMVCNVTDSIRRLDEEVDVVVVVLHWGASWTQEVTVSQIEMADEFVYAGADIVVGHHPHMLQAIEMNNNALMIFSLGNFVFRPDYVMPSNAHNSLVVFIEIVEKEVRRCYLYPIRLDVYGIPRVPGSEESSVILSNLADLSGAFNTWVEIDGEVGMIHMP